MKAIFIASVVTILVSTAASGQTMKHDQMMDGNQAGMMADSGLPRETGQSAFAAILEIVAMLEADPKTDWSKVDIEALRQHVIDMNNVTLGAVVTAKQSADSTRFSISGAGQVQASIRRMVIAHAATMNGADGWKFAAETTDAGVVLTVKPPDQVSMMKLRALGFIGILALGMHHQQHHWMLANGMSPH